MGRTKRFTYFFRSKESLRNLKYPQREDLGFSTITVQLLLMAKILDCALAPTNKAEKHRSRRMERRGPRGDLILERGKEEEEMSFRQREHKR